MFKSVSVIALLLAGVLMGLILSGRASEQPEMIARAPAAAAPAIEPPAPAAQPPQVVGNAAPDFTRVAAQTVRAVTNISSVQVMRRSSSPFANDPFFQSYSSATPMICSAAAARSRAWARAS